MLWGGQFRPRTKMLWGEGYHGHQKCCRGGRKFASFPIPVAILILSISLPAHALSLWRLDFPLERLFLAFFSTRNLINMAAAANGNDFIYFINKNVVGGWVNEKNVVGGG